MKTALFLILASLVVGCAQTVFYRDGKKIAAFQGDMTGVEYYDGDIRWKSDTVDHSAATKAQGEAASTKITAAGAAIAGAGITTILR